jgi:gliding motility-associated-like protein
MRSFFSTLFLAVLQLFSSQCLHAQAPIIKYTTPHSYLLNTPINSLVPTNTGGPVPVATYGLVSTLAGTGRPGFNNGPVLTATFNQPRDVAPDAFGNIYLVDDGNLIRKITPAGVVTAFAGNGNIGFADGVGAAASFSNPTNIAVDASGNVYVADNNNNAIRKITPNGTVSTIAGNGSRGFSDGKGSAATFNTPSGIAVDANGIIYVADQFNNRIRKIDQAGLVTTMAGNGSYGASDGQGAAASFSQPVDVTTDAAGNIYVADGGNNKIRKVTPAGLVTTFAGNGAPGFADGTGTAAAFAFPLAIVADKAGNLYVADAIYNQRIRKITPSQVVTTLAGNGNIGFDNGIGTAATFSYPYGIGIDNAGNLYIADNQNEVYRKISTSGYTIDKQLPAGLNFDPATGVISGKPTELWPATNYTVRAYNGSGSSSTIVNIQVLLTLPLKPSIITFPPPVNINIDASNILHPDATSTNTETPITYTSSNPAVAYIGTDGQVHVIAPGVTTITANQAGNENYSPANAVQEVFTIKQDQIISFPVIAVKSTCSADFAAGAISSNALIPMVYSNTNPAVATVSATGSIHIVGPGTTTITVSQAGSALYNQALPVSQTLTVNPLITPSVKISPDFYASCDGILLSYTATPINGGGNPTYQWKLNGNNSGDNSDVYTSTTLKTGDVITCIVTNNDQCTPVSSPVSNPVSLSSDPFVTIGLVITSSATTVDAGTPITFKATASANVQIAPAYTWMVNGQIAGTNSATFTSNTLSDGDVVTCGILITGKCIVNPSVTSNSITVSILIPQKIIIPNAFTPNGDGSNDTWSIAALLSYPNCTVSIYNRYGAAVYQSKGYQYPWDGRMNGKQLPAGTYYYIIDTQKNNQKLSGPVTILR